MNTEAGTPARWAAHATAWAWFPADGATTPAARSESLSDWIFVYAPRTLNAPVFCWFSCFSSTSHPASRENVSDRSSGVLCTTSRRPAAAAWICSRSTIEVTANPTRLD